MRGKTIEPGQVDDMSLAAARARAATCGKQHGDGHRCTRAAGHHETIEGYHTAALHVATTIGFIVLAVWDR
jgi:hypothetical protein